MICYSSLILPASALSWQLIASGLRETFHKLLKTALPQSDTLLPWLHSKWTLWDNYCGGAPVAWVLHSLLPMKSSLPSLEVFCFGYRCDRMARSVFWWVKKCREIFNILHRHSMREIQSSPKPQLLKLFPSFLQCTKKVLRE